MNKIHVVLNYDKFQFHYSNDKQVYYCTPSFEEGFVIVLWIGRDGLPEALPEKTIEIFKHINRGFIKVDRIIK